MMKKLLLLAGLLSLGLTGCCSRCESLEKRNAELEKRSDASEKRIAALEKQNARILSELRTIRAGLNVMGRRPSGGRLSPSFGVDRHISVKIKPLPPDPTDEQIVAYVQAILEISANQRIFTDNDPQVALLRKIGPGHFKALLSFLKNGTGHNRFRGGMLHLLRALPSLVSDQDIPLIRENLSSMPVLFHAIPSVGFARSMKPEIFRALKTPSSVPPARVLPFIFSLAETPEDRKILEGLYWRGPDRRISALMAATPGFDIKNLSVRVWKSVQNRDFSPFILRERAKDAARYGHDVSACKFLLKSLTALDERRRWEMQEIQNVLSLVSDFPVYDRKRLAAWYGENHERIAFDEKTGRFTLKK